MVYLLASRWSAHLRSKGSVIQSFFRRRRTRDSLFTGRAAALVLLPVAFIWLLHMRLIPRQARQLAKHPQPIFLSSRLILAPHLYGILHSTGPLSHNALTPYRPILDCKQAHDYWYFKASFPQTRSKPSLQVRPIKSIGVMPDCFPASTGTNTASQEPCGSALA